MTATTHRGMAASTGHRGEEPPIEDAPRPVLPREIKRMIARVAALRREIERMPKSRSMVEDQSADTAALLLEDAKNALARSEGLFRGLIHQAPVAVLKLTEDGAILFANDTAERAAGKGNLVGLNWGEIFAEPRTAACDWAWLARHRGRDRDVGFLTGDRSSRIMAWKLVQDIQSTARPRYFAYGVDVTERNRIEMELRQSREHLARAQRVAGIGSAELDFVTGAIHWSDETYRIFGIAPGSIGLDIETVTSLIDPDDRERWRAAYHAAPIGIVPTAGEFRLIRPDGATRIISRELETILDESGVPSRLIGTIKDITDLRQAERQRDELQRELVQAHRLEAIGTLANGIAHDLNNVLLPVLALTKLVLSHLDENNRDRANLQLIYEAGERGRRLVQQVLAFNRKGNAEKTLVQIDAVAEDALRMLRASIPSTIRIEQRITKVPPVLGDAGRLYQVFLNLITNAAQAIGDRQGTIIVDVDGVLTTPTPAVLISVADDGCGMDEATMARIFEPFFTTKADGQGTGIGLSVVHGIVTQHGGSIKVESKPLHGARIDVCIPAHLGRGRRDEIAGPASPRRRQRVPGSLSDAPPLSR
jgi:PAS domain S-box-containing protein